MRNFSYEVLNISWEVKKIKAIADSSNARCSTESEASCAAIRSIVEHVCSRPSAESLLLDVVISGFSHKSIAPLIQMHAEDAEASLCLIGIYGVGSENKLAGQAKAHPHYS